MRALLLLCLVTSSLFAQKQTTPLDKRIQEFEAYILKAQKEWEVPGLSVAVVKDGKVILAKGYGVRELGTSNAVDAQTLFACASTTKAMTATCMGILVDEGKIKWDDAVVTHLPEFQLYDPFMTREIKIRDLLIHDTGVGNADFLWDIMAVSSDEVLRKMRDVKPSYSMRSSFIYQNIFYLAAGKVIEKVSGKPWGQFVSERIFQPLGMTRTVPFRKDVTDPNQTMPHYNIEGKITVIQHTNADVIGPAGSVWSSAEDMGKWMQCMLDSSKYAGGRLLTAKTWIEMFRPQVLVPANEFYPTQQLTKPNWTTYALGWFQHDYKGKKVNFHTGSLAGATAIHGQLPEERLGIYVFGNYDHAEVRHALVYKAFDHFALGGTRDWSADFLKLYKNIQSGWEKSQKDFEAKRVAGTKPSLPLEVYAGTYSDPLYGEVVITLQGDQLTVVANNYLKATFTHWHYDTFRGWYDKKWNGKGNASFVLGTDGKISKVNFDGIEFKRMGN
jgi:CubicO group peptidase (beta-lactamase class C family)